MSKQKNPESSAMVRPPVIPPVEIRGPVPVPLEASPAAVAFPTKVRCPRCKSLNTRQYGQRDRVGYYRCQVAPCRHSFQVVGKEV